MSPNEDLRLPDEGSTAPGVPARRSTLVGPPEGGWIDVPEFAGPAEPRSPGVSLSTYLHGLRRHWILATFLGLLCAGAAGVVVFFWAWGPQYTARASFQIRQREPRRVFETAATPAERFTESAYDIYKHTQAQLITHPNILAGALRADNKVSVLLPRENQTKSIEVDNLPSVKAERDPITWLQDELVVTFPGDGELMQVSLTGSDPEEAAALVEAVVRAYTSKVVEAEQAERRARLSDLQTLYTDREEDVRKKTTELRRLARSAGTDDPDALRLKQQMALQESATRSRLHAQTQALLEHARGELKGQQTYLANAENIPIPRIDVENYVDLRPQTRNLAAELTTRLLEMAEIEKNANPRSAARFPQGRASDVSLLQAELDALASDAEQKIREKKISEIEEKTRELEIMVESYENEEQRLAEQVKQAEAEVDRLSTTSVDLEMMRAEIDRLNDLLGNIQDEQEKLEVEVSSEPRITAPRTDENTVVPITESKLGIRIALTVIATIAGLCIPIVSIVWWDSRAGCVNSPADVSKGLGLKVLGSVPMIPSRVIRQLGSPSKRHQTWHLRLTESVDGIAARLLRQADLEETRVILVSSAASGEGKTTLATQLAMSLARNGRLTALVDFDLRRPALDGVFGLPLEPGISEVLRGETEASEVVHETATDNLSVVTAGRWDRQTLTALANGAAGSLFKELRAKFKFVVVDAAPILPVADTRFVSQQVDAVILSVFRDVSQAPKIAAAREILESFGVGTVEAVVTGPSENLRDKSSRYEASLPA